MIQIETMVRLPLAFMSLVAVGALIGCSTPNTTTWVSAGNMTEGRSNHSATLLVNDSVLFVGGNQGIRGLASTEIHDTSTNLWSVGPLMSEARTQHAAVRLADGRVVVLGGKKINGSASSSVEVFDAATAKFVSAAPMMDARIRPAALIVKAPEHVIVVGGQGKTSALATAESYDPAADMWSVLPNMAAARAEHTMTMLDDHTLVVVGGVDDTQVQTTVEAYDATKNAWTSLSDVNEGRHDHTATVLRDGTILVVGGVNHAGVLSSAERYDRQTNAWSPAGALHVGRHGHTATLLNDGRVLIAGGQDAQGAIDSVELYDTVESSFVEAEPLSMSRAGHTATWLADGSVLVVGGGSSNDLTSTERFVPEDSRLSCERSTDCPQAMVCNEGWCEQEPWPLSSKSACSYAPEHASTNTGTVMALSAILGALWCMRRKWRAKAIGASCIALTLVALPDLAHAQVPTFYLDRLPIAGGVEDGTAVWRPVFGQTGMFAQAAVGYARNPLRVASFVHDATQARALQGSAITLQVTGYASAGVEIAKRGAIQVTVPYVVAQHGYGTEARSVGLDAVLNLAPSALGDMRIDGRMLVGANDAQTFVVAVRGAFYLPTGNEVAFTGERSAWGNAGLSTEYSNSAFTIAANMGLTVRPRSTFIDLTVGSEFVYALGVYLPLVDDRIRLGAELFGALGVSSFDPMATPVEAAVSGRFALGAQRRVFMGMSVGGHLGPGYAPDVRFVARLGGVVPFEQDEPEPSLPRRVVPVVEVDDAMPAPEVDKCALSRPESERRKAGCIDDDPDKDGIVAPADVCPTKAEDKDGIDDTDGCPEEDADEDGIADVDDKCPKAPGTRGEDPAKIGCPQFIERTASEVKLNKQIDFEFNKATIAKVSFPILDEIAKLLVANPDIKQMRIEGYTDDVGSVTFNKNLSLRRAEAVRDYLVKQGNVAPERLRFAGFGPEKPVAPNTTEAGRAKNRRVELHIGNTGSEPEKKP